MGRCVDGRILKRESQRIGNRITLEDMGRIVQKEGIVGVVGVFVMHCFIYESMDKLRNLVVIVNYQARFVYLCTKSFNKPIEIVVVFRVSLFLIVH